MGIGEDGAGGKEKGAALRVPSIMSGLGGKPTPLVAAMASRCAALMSASWLRIEKKRFVFRPAWRLLAAKNFK